MSNRLVQMVAADGHSLSGYEAMPTGEVRGGVVVLQEIFGVTRHIRAVCDDLAAQGYRAIAPALFDRIRPAIELPYSQEGALEGRDLREQVGWTAALADTAAAVKMLEGQVAVMGFCWGGTVAWLSATRTKEVRAAVCYYPTQILPFVEEKPTCPVIVHVGERDPFAPLSTVGALRANHGAILEIHVYAAGHGFNCNDRADFHAPSAQAARERTFGFLAKHL